MYQQLSLGKNVLSLIRQIKLTMITELSKLIKEYKNLKSYLTIFLLILLAIVSIGAVFYLKNQDINNLDVDAPVATVNGIDISKNSIEAIVDISGEDKAVVLDKLIKAEVLEQFLNKTGFTVTSAEIYKNIKSGEKINVNTKLNSKLDILKRKIKAFFQLDESGFNKKYEEVKSQATIKVHIKL